MRVIGGTLGGRRLSAPPGRDTRPTADRVREALFSSIGAALPGAAVLDLYAGSGALGIEALSRGAASAVFVESDRRAAAVVERNLAALELDARVLRTSAERFCATPSGGPFHVVLCDPPYSTALAAVHACLCDLHAAAALLPAATVVIERDRRDPHLDDAPPGFLASRRRRTYGDTVLLFSEVSEGTGP